MNERYPWKAALCAAFLVTGLLNSSLSGAQVSISPVRINLDQSQTKDTIRVGNQRDTEASYEIEVVAWSQTDDRREIYTPTEDVIAVPPLFTLKPGDEQVVRVGLLTDVDDSTERAYRVFITELADPDDAEVEGAAVNMRLRLGVPLFVAPTALPHATLDFENSMQLEDNLFMRLRNSGNTHVRVSEIHFLAPNLTEPAVESAAIYILAGKSAYVPVVLTDGKLEGTVHLVTDTLGIVEYDLASLD
jgi:fimbrial chaperone protein